MRDWMIILINRKSKFLISREAEGKPNRCNWTDGESVFRWWIGDESDPNQLSFFEEEE